MAPKKAAAGASAPTRKPPTRAAKTKANEGIGGESDKPTARAPPKKTKASSSKGKSKTAKSSKRRRTGSDDEDERDGGVGAGPVPSTAGPSSKRRKTGKRKVKARAVDPPPGGADDRDAEQDAPGPVDEGTPDPIDPDAPGPDVDVPGPDADVVDPDVAGPGPVEDADGLDEVTYWNELQTFAEAQADHQCTYRANDARLTVHVKVHPDPTESQSRLGYYARFKMRHAAGADDREDGVGNDIIGSIQSWRIAKPTGQFPNAEGEAWIQDLLSARKKDDLIRETAECMQVLFNRDGTLKKAAREHADKLEQNSLMFIEMVHIRQAFARNRLLRPAMEAWYEALRRLPEWFAFSGTLVLVPSRPDGDKGEIYGDMTDGEVEDTLINVYTNRGFETWVRNAKLGGHLYTVMGRTMPEAAEAEEGRDGDGEGS